MKTFDELKSLLSRDLSELKKLQESRFSTIEKRHVKEQNIGRLCYEAEEDLGTLELNALKRTIGMSETEWRAYKAKFIAGNSPEEFL
jgi:hypothetical protein